MSTSWLNTGLRSRSHCHKTRLPNSRHVACCLNNCHNSISESVHVIRWTWIKISNGHRSENPFDLNPVSVEARQFLHLYLPTDQRHFTCRTCGQEHWKVRGDLHQWRTVLNEVSVALCRIILPRSFSPVGLWHLYTWSRQTEVQTLLVNRCWCYDGRVAPGQVYWILTCECASFLGVGEAEECRNAQRLALGFSTSSEQSAIAPHVTQILSSGMLRRLALVRSDVSEELNASIIRVTRIGELGTMLTVTSNRRTLVASYG
jgi:hypothetical protein